METHVTDYFLRWKSHHNALVSVLDTLMTTEKYVDVTLAAEGRFINVHRLVMIASSPYFEVFIIVVIFIMLKYGFKIINLSCLIKKGKHVIKIFPGD